MNTLSSIDPKRLCVPKTTGEHPGEWHEAGHSWIDQRTLGVAVSVRHLGTGDVSQVPLSDVVFGVDAERFLELPTPHEKGGAATAKDSGNEKGISDAACISAPGSSERLPGAARLQLVGDCRKTQGVSAGNTAENLPKPDMSPLEIAAKCPTRHMETSSGVVVTLPVMCAWCRLWRVDSVWTATAPANVSKVSHGICPPCKDKLLAEVAA